MKTCILLFMAAFCGFFLNTDTAFSARAMLLIDASDGRVLFEKNATKPWFPASLTKIMTLYVTLEAIENQEISLSSIVTMSERGRREPPSKMGFKVGTQFTVENALKMIMVKSANDVSVALAERVAGNLENFIRRMNNTAGRLGMVQTNFVNPHGLPNDFQRSSAKDMAILSRALLLNYASYSQLWQLPAIRLGKVVMRNYNRLIDRYPFVTGLKTGFICSSGFNLAASARKDGKELIAIVMGAQNSKQRANAAAHLLEYGFNHAVNELFTLRRNVNQLPITHGIPIDLRPEICNAPPKGQAKPDPLRDWIPRNNAETILRTAMMEQEIFTTRLRPLVADRIYLGAARGAPAIVPFPVPRSSIGLAYSPEQIAVRGQGSDDGNDEPSLSISNPANTIPLPPLSPSSRSASR